MENNNLNTLRILYIIKGILTLLTALIILGVFVIGGSFISQQDFPQDEVPFNPGAVMSGMGLFMFIIVLALGIVTLYAAKFIKERRNHTFIFVIAIINCLSGILGLALGIFTIVEIQKTEIKQLFSGATV